MRRLLLSGSFLILMAAPALADGVSPLCPDYGGHLDMEGKLGERDIAETSVFLPVACTKERLLFSDLRFKLDNESNREVNVGLGGRLMMDTGILGTYAYFDRKLSGTTDKMFSQITLGSEWLAEGWEVRGNVYIPLSGEKTIGTTGSSGTPFLSGSGIFVNQIAGATITEEGLYGADAEAGFKIPTTDFWLHAGAFSFHGDDAPSVEGVRARARYDLTDNLSLIAEGQYDDERGRMGWLGARVTIPFGGPAEKPEGLAARMTASPVRDVDIVTQAKVEKNGSDGIVPVLNAESGAAQRVLYVDNSAGGGGDGTLDNPFNTLSAAQAALADNDVIYVHRGDGTTTGMNTGFNINRSGVMFIGSGSDFVYDGSRFTTQNNFANPNGFTLIQKTAAPVITNVNAGGDGIHISGANANISGFNVQNATRDGVRILGNAQDLGTANIGNVTVTNSGFRGIYTMIQNGGNLDSLNIYNFTAINNGYDGMRVQADSNATIGNVSLSAVESSGSGAVNAGYGRGVLLYANDGGRITQAEISETTATGNLLQGVYIISQAAGIIDDVSAHDIYSAGNNGPGVYAFATGANSAIHNLYLGNILSENNISGEGHGVKVHANSNASIGNATLQNVSATGNARQGIFIHGQSSSTINASVENSLTTGNAEHGIAVYDDTSGTFEVDLGGGGRSIGNNYIAGNTLEDIAIDYDGRTLFAQNNWWGQSSGIYQSAPNMGLKPQIYYGAPLSTNLAAHWTFDTEWMDNTTAYDRSTMGNNGTLHGDLDMGDLVTAQSRQGLQFDDVNEYIQIPETPTLKITDAITISAWVSRGEGPDGQWQPIFQGSGNLNTPIGVYFGYISGQNTFSFRTGSGSAASHASISMPALDTPFLATGTYSASTGRIMLYINGALVADNAGEGINYQNSRPNRIGALSYCCVNTATPHLLDGTIDDLRIYDSALTATQIAELYRTNTTSVLDSSNYRTVTP